MNTDHDLVRELSRRNPVREQDVRDVTRGQHRSLANAWTDDGDVAPSVGSRPRGLRRRRVATMLVAASVAGLVVTSTVLAGGWQGLQDRVAVAGMPDYPEPDRAAEQAQLDMWVDDVVGCLVEQYDPWVTPVDGGYVYDGDGRLAAMPGNETVYFDDDCRSAAGPQPQAAPISPQETRRYLDELRSTGQCLRDLGFEVPEEPWYLRVTAGGLLRTDAKAITAQEKLDGKYLLRSNEPHLSAEDIALGYKQLLEVERGWHDWGHLPRSGGKSILDLRPVHHRLEDRIRAHVILCWLALLLIRIIETTTGDTRTNLRRELQRLAVGTFTGPAGTYRQTTQTTTTQTQILAQLDLAPPSRILTLDTTPEA